MAGGNNVWLQMRRMRTTSRRTMVPSAIRVPAAFMQPPCRRLRSGAQGSSSSRLDLFRIEVTVMPSADKAANREFRSCARDISASMVWSSTRVIFTPSTCGNWAHTLAARSSTKVSTSSLPSRCFIAVSTMIRHVVDDGDVAAQLFGFFQIVRGQDHRGARLH